MKKQIEKLNTIVAQATEVVRQGGIILYPTDTVWGLGCDATNEEAVRKLALLKGKGAHCAMLVLLAQDALLPSYVRTVPEIAYDLIDVAVRPLTIIYPDAKNLAPSLLASDGSIGIRITREEVSAALCTRLRVPLVSTSANFSGEPTPLCYREINPELIKQVDYVVPLRQEEAPVKTKPSEIIKVGVDGAVTLIRS